MPGASPALADHTAAERLAYIQRRLRAGASRSTIWAVGWGMTYGTIATAQAIRIPLSQESVSRNEAAIASGSALIGAAFLAISPPAIIGDARRLDAQIARARPGTDLCPVLADAERYLLRDAASDEFGVGWVMQGSAIAYNIGLGLLFGLAFNDWVAGAITTAVGIAVSQGMTLTRPTDSIDASRRYRAGDLRATTARSTSYWVAAPDIATNRVGVRLQITF